MTYPDGTTPVMTAADSHYDYAGEVAKGKAVQADANLQFAQFGSHTAKGDKFAADYEVGARQADVDATKAGTPERAAAEKLLTDAKTQQGKAANNVKVTDAYLNLASASQKVADFDVFKKKAVDNFAAKEPNRFLFEPNKEYYSGGGDYKGKITSREVFEKDGQLFLRLKFEHGSEEERALTYDPNDKDVREDLRNDPINQEWLTISRGWNKNACVAGNIEDLKKNMWTAAEQLKGAQIEQIDRSIGDLGKTRTTLQTVLDKAIKDHDPGTVEAPAGTLKPGEQPVRIPIGNGVEVEVSPDVAAAVKRGDSDAIAKAKAVHVQMNGQWLWVHPEVADAQVALDMLDKQESTLRQQKTSLTLARNRYDFASTHTLKFMVDMPGAEEKTSSDKAFLDQRRDQALDGYQIQLKGYTDKFADPLKTDLRATVQKALNLDPSQSEGREALDKTVKEIHDVGGANPGVRVVPMIYVDDKVGSIQTALFEVKD
ncbi:MAG: hypothetical protein E5W38_22405, partial [Mesorhizobium sp.]